MTVQYFQIAIDGPVAAGKSTVAKMLAEKFNAVYVDSGAMYRVVALDCEREGISWENEGAVGERARKVEICLARPVGKKKDGRPVTVYLGDEDVSWEIRNSHIGEGASVVGQYRGVREALVKIQRRMARGARVVMEGRDIGTKVLPDAEVKIYMTADVDKRVERKWRYLKERGIVMTKEQVKDDLVRRDTREMTRKNNPLIPARGAWILDTTGMEIDEVVEKIVERVEELT